MTIPILVRAARRRRPGRFRCLECEGWRLRKYKGSRIHRKCWLEIEAGLR